MKCVLICEGSTDLVLIQYFLEKTYNWEYIPQNRHNDLDLNKFNRAKEFKWFKQTSENKFLCIVAAGGSTQISYQLEQLLLRNSAVMEKDLLVDKIILLTDNDDENTEVEILDNVKSVFDEKNITSGDLQNNNWNVVNYDWVGENVSLEFLPLIIPFETTGAIEDFLLNALKTESLCSDGVISNIIDECRRFIENLDCQGRYLTKRREKTKAKFTSVFVVLTPADAFAERKNLLQSVPWEEYQHVQTAFEKLALI
ncbi:DUF3226 domain-containing protein [Lysinibacillus sphaericus]|uniref:DUF3226 domain-containing protein n=1 Tax=Lysinibacillus sphaericus TaxID=1421 RepID=UPI00248A9AB4|nr:DUF3226 domain-containing protein [Lysinibacillus sphaericus]